METKDASSYAKELSFKILVGLRWIGFGIITGIIVGLVSGYFAKAIVLATSFRENHGIIIWLMPFAGLFIVWLYRTLGAKDPKGTNLVLESIRNGTRVPLRMTPLIIISTVITHLFGGSVGREGAALQVGGSLGNFLGRILRISKKDRRTVTMCGMSASFSALFGTPMAAAIMAMEISTVGIMHYSALVPCVIASLTARLVAEMIGVKESSLVLNSVPAFTGVNALWVILLSFLSALVSVLFSVSMHRTKHFFKKNITNPYLRVFATGLLIASLTAIFGTQRYNGTGSGMLENCILQPGFYAEWYDFILKILFTAVTLSGGFQGGEIVPSLFIGASFGSFFALMTGVDPSLSSAIGMTSVFCGVTNCPIAALLISFELFGFDAGLYFMLAVAITYLFSGNFGIYSSQVIRYDKFLADRIDQNTY